MNNVDATTLIDYSYSDFHNGIERIVQQIKDSNFEPRYIVGVVRGGAIPAVYLSHRLKIPVVMVQWNTRDETQWGNESICWIPEDINNGDNILLVDDIVDGGDTIKELLDDWNNSIVDDLEVDNIRIAAMYYNTAQDVNVDYYDRAINREEDKRWVIFPWEA